jgi:large subunit ribosomal protein L21
MYAIVDVKDKQFKVRENDTLYVPYHSDAEVDDTLTLDRVMLLSNGEGDVTLGTPTVDDASVTARVVDQVKGDKVIVFKKKRRKRYRVKRGHRQQYTKIYVESLNTNGSAPAPATDEPAADEDDEQPAADASAPADAEAQEAEAPEAEAPEAETDTEEVDTDAPEAEADTDTADAEADTDAEAEADTESDDAGDEDDDKA